MDGRSVRRNRNPRVVHLPKYKYFLRRLREARELAGLSQADVGRDLGQDQAFVSKCENGERRVDAVEFFEFLKLYGKPLKYYMPADE